MKQINLSTKRFDLIGFMLFLAIYFLSQYGIIYSQTWNQTTSFPGTPRDDASHFKIGTKHFIGRGREVGFGCTRDFYFFDESTSSISEDQQNSIIEKLLEFLQDKTVVMVAHRKSLIDKFKNYISL